MEAIALLESLPKGWDWSISKYGTHYFVRIANEGLHREPQYTSSYALPLNPKKPQNYSLNETVQATYDLYMRSEKEIADAMIAAEATQAKE